MVEKDFSSFFQIGHGRVLSVKSTSFSTQDKMSEHDIIKIEQTTMANLDATEVVETEKDSHQDAKKSEFRCAKCGAQPSTMEKLAEHIGTHSQHARCRKYSFQS